MSSDTPNFDERVESLDKRIGRLREHLPPQPKSVPPPKHVPIDWIRLFLFLLVLGAGSGLIGSLIDAFANTDSLVFVARVDGEYEVWSSTSAFEEDTGQEWLRQPGGMITVYHDARKKRALESLSMNGFVLIFAAFCLYKHGQQKRQFQGPGTH